MQHDRAGSRNEGDNVLTRSFLRTGTRQRAWKPPAFAISAAAVLAAAFFPAPAVALTLDQALASTYECSPAIDAERARLRAIDEDVPIAQSGYRPDIAARADVGYRNQNNPSNGGSTNQTPRGWGVDLVQPIFRGFSVTNAVNEAQSRVRAGRETLRAVEQEKLAEAVTTFMEVVAQQAILKLNENNLNVLNEELKATRDRFAVGEVTRTDVAQSEARRADAVAQVDQARADLQTARAAFERTVCQPADRLVEPALKKDMLPKSQNEAVDISMQENPRIVGASTPSRRHASMWIPFAGSCCRRCRSKRITITTLTTISLMVRAKLLRFAAS